MWGSTVSTPESLGKVQHLLPGPAGMQTIGVDGIDLLLGTLDRGGGLVGAPTRLNPGAPIGGRVSVVRWGERLAVAWRAEGVWVTAIEDGRAAPPLWVEGLNPYLVASDGQLRLFRGVFRDGAWKAAEASVWCDGTLSP